MKRRGIFKSLLGLVLAPFLPKAVKQSSGWPSVGEFDDAWIASNRLYVKLNPEWINAPLVEIGLARANRISVMSANRIRLGNLENEYYKDWRETGKRFTAQSQGEGISKCWLSSTMREVPRYIPA